jgi:hypothetical protein
MTFIVHDTSCSIEIANVVRGDADVVKSNTCPRRQITLTLW